MAYAAIHDQLVGDRDALQASLSELRSVTTRYDFIYYGSWGRVLAGWLQGGDRGVSAIRSALKSLREIGALVRMPFWQALLAEAMLTAGRSTRRSPSCGRHSARPRRRGDVWWLPEVLRLQATLAAPALAGPLREQGLALARSHGSVALVERYER